MSEILKGEETILLVDDEDIVIDVGSGMMERLGYEVLIAKNGNEAVGIFKDRLEDIALTILDMFMPGMNGNETFDELIKIKPDIKVLLSSGLGDSSQADEMMGKGCKGFIQKPFNLIELSQKLREVIES